MWVREANNNDGYIVIYEPGDKIKMIDSDAWYYKEGDTGTVTDGPYYRNAVILYEINLNQLSSSWGRIDVPQRYFEPYGITKLQLPEVIREWKQEQAKKLLGVSDERR